MNNHTYFIIGVLIFSATQILAQSEGLTSSPYSLYGLGIINQSSFGKSNGMGYTGIALKTNTEINNLNPATYALIPQYSFFYDIGVSGEHNSYSNVANTENRTTFNFSNIAFAFRIGEGMGAGISMVPYSDVGYSIVGLQSNIEGSTETFESSITGLGGLNDLRFNFGYRIIPGLRLGFSGSVLFGNIDEEETFVISNSSFQSTENTNYRGLRMGFGLQYDLFENITFGSTVQLPTSLTGNLQRSVVKTINATEISVEDEVAYYLPNFNMPLELGFGISGKFYDKVTITADYKKNNWSSTGQTENIGSYVDQNVYAFGMEYRKDARSFKYGQRISYRAGFNYDDGYLAINNTKIDGFNLTTGIGLPISGGTNSMINLSYGFGSKGSIQNVLIK